MRHLGFTLALLAAGCTLQITPITPSASGSPGPGESPKPGRSSVPSTKATASPPPPASPGVLASPNPAACDGLFKQLDTAPDDKLTTDEYVSGMTAIYVGQHKGEPVSSCGEPNLPALLKEAYAILDRDQDGAVSRAEFTADCNAMPTDDVTPIRRPFLSPARCAKHFAEHDKDQDGRWSREEFEQGWLQPYFPYGPILPRAVLRYGLLCSPMAQPPLGQYFLNFDMNDDGAIDQDEACSLFTGAKPYAGIPPVAPRDVEVPAPNLTGTWTIAPDDQATGTLHLDPCVKYRRFYFPVKNGSGSGPEIVVSDANAGPSRGYSSEELVILRPNGRDAWQFIGTEVAPGPTDAPEKRPVTYDLRYDPKTRLLVGARTVQGQKSQPIRLIETDVVGDCPVAQASTPPSVGWPPPKESVVFEARYSGGMCPTGLCSSVITFLGSGAFKRGGKAGQLDPALVEALLKQAQLADFAAIKGKKFTGTCPTAYDGSELTYVFSTPHGEEVIPSCTYAVDGAHPLFVAASKLIGAAEASP